MPSAGKIRPNTVSAGIWTTPRHRPVSTITLSRTLVNSPKKPFRSPMTHRRGPGCAVAIVLMSRPPRLELPLRREIAAPSAEACDLRSTLAQARLAQHAQHDRAVLQHHFSDGEPGRL